MGRIRSECENKSASEISLKLREEFNINTTQLFDFWKTYQIFKEKYKEIGLSRQYIMDDLNRNWNSKFTNYFAALAMEIISKEIIEGINNEN